jgi:hypothetical protein
MIDCIAAATGYSLVHHVLSLFKQVAILVVIPPSIDEAMVSIANGKGGK